jgi:hypothetical protein
MNNNFNIFHDLICQDCESRFGGGRTVEASVRLGVVMSASSWHNIHQASSFTLHIEAAISIRLFGAGRPYDTLFGGAQLARVHPEDK